MNDQFKRSVTLPFHDSLGLAVYRSGLQKCGPGFCWGPAIRDHYLIHYVVSGKGSYDSGSARYTLSAGDGFLVVPDRVISYRADQDDPWEYCWVGFNGTDAPRLVSQTGLSKNNPVFHYSKDGKLKDLLTQIFEATGSRHCDEARMQAGLLNFLAVLMEEFGSQAEPNKSGYEYVKKSIQFIDFNYSQEDIDVGDIAANAGISRSHLYRLFVQHTSMTPSEYLTRYRIDRAATLLKCNNLSVGEAAYSTGFSDQLYFSRVFKKYKGLPPSKWAERERLVQRGQKEETE